jgi:hypothetical protein
LPRDSPGSGDRLIAFSAYGSHQRAEQYERLGAAFASADRPGYRRVADANDLHAAATGILDLCAVAEAGRAVAAKTEAEALGVVHGDSLARNLVAKRQQLSQTIGASMRDP